jgi:Mb-OB3b family methanobactin precursor
MFNPILQFNFQSIGNTMKIVIVKKVEIQVAGRTGMRCASSCGAKS